MKRFLRIHLPLICIGIFLLASWLFAVKKVQIARIADSILVRFDESSEYSKNSIARAKTSPESSMKETFQIKGLRYAQRKVGEAVAIPPPETPSADPFPLSQQEEGFSGFLADSCLRDWAVVPPVKLSLQNGASPLTGFDQPFPADPGIEGAPQWKILHFTAGSGIIAPGSTFSAPDTKSWYLYTLSTKLKGLKKEKAKLVFSSDGFLLIRWNGKEVYRSEKQGQCRKDAVSSVDIDLSDAESRLDIRAVAYGDKMNFFVRLTTIFDEPLSFSGPEINF